MTANLPLSDCRALVMFGATGDLAQRGQLHARTLRRHRGRGKLREWQRRSSRHPQRRPHRCDGLVGHALGRRDVHHISIATAPVVLPSRIPATASR